MKKSRLAAAFMALFFGGFGVHKFYLGDAGGGIFYLVLMFMTARWFPVSSLLGIFDAIRLFSLSDDEFDGKYNKAYYESAEYTKNPRRYTRLKVTDKNRRRQTPQPMNNKRKSATRDNPFKRSGMKKYADYDLDGAIDDLKHGLELSPDDQEIHLALAGAYSLLEKKDASYFHIEEAIRCGLKDTNRILEMDDLAFVRIQEDFESFKKNGFRRKDPEISSREEMPEDDLLLSQLNKLKDLRSKGLLSQKEFILEKDKLLRK